MPKLTDDGEYGVGPFANMAVGETRTHTFAKTGVTKTITRTARPFLFDWHDASNRELEAKGSNMRWLVNAADDGSGDATLVDIRHTNHPSMKPWRPTPEELEEAKAQVDAAISDGATMAEFRDWLERRGRS